MYQKLQAVKDPRAAPRSCDAEMSRILPRVSFVRSCVTFKNAEPGGRRAPASYLYQFFFILSELNVNYNKALTFMRSQPPKLPLLERAVTSLLYQKHWCEEVFKKPGIFC